VLEGQSGTEKCCTVKDWPARGDSVPGNINVKNAPLVNPKWMLLPPLHLKTGAYEELVKALDKSGVSFHQCSKFLYLVDAEVE
jgi:hypothetical protein